MSAVFYIKRGDRGPSVEATLLGPDPDREPIVLTNASAVRFKMEPSLDEAAVIVSAAEGTVRYDWAASQTDTAGKFKAEFEIEWNDGRLQTVPNRGYIAVYITEDLD